MLMVVEVWDVGCGRGLGKMLVYMVTGSALDREPLMEYLMRSENPFGYS